MDWNKIVELSGVIGIYEYNKQNIWDHKCFDYAPPTQLATTNSHGLMIFY